MGKPETVCTPTTGGSACITPHWLLNPKDAKNKEICATVPGSFELLNCGENAFREVYHAIANAKKSVCIVNLGFQPSMYFIRENALSFEHLMDGKRNGNPYSYKRSENTPGRGGYSLPIGELLMQKAAEGVKVRVLAWTFDIASVNLVGRFFADSPEPGRASYRWSDRSFTHNDYQYEFDLGWYAAFDHTITSVKGVVDLPMRILFGLAGSVVGLAVANRTANVVANIENKIRDTFNKTRANLHFRTRGFTLKDRVNQLFKGLIDQLGLSNKFIDHNVNWKADAIMSIFASHHQKTVLVDYEDPENHVGFVMGHNMLDEYWDYERHSYHRQEYYSGRNSAMPRQDYSSRITGPLVRGVYLNFKDGWEREGGGDKLGADPDFTKYKIHPNKSKPEMEVFGQILRTKRNESEADIAKAYLHALRYATRCVYIENQYFRWPPLAEAVLAQADLLYGNGRQLENPEHGGALHLFVISNTSKDGIGDGTAKTAEMLDKLGRADTVPNVAKSTVKNDVGRNKDECKRVEKALKKKNKEIEAFDKKSRSIADTESRNWKNYGSQPATDVWNGPNGRHARAQELAEEKAELEREKARLEQQREELAARKKAKDEGKNEPILPAARPGLKVHICSLVPGDTPPAATPGMNISELQDKIEENEKALSQARNQRGLVLEMGSIKANPRLESRIAELLKEQQFLREEYAKRGEAAYTREQKQETDGTLRDVWVWPEVYVHSKLMILDDTYMTIGSTNINTRSMENDSEMNVAHHNDVISRAERLRIWALHTNGLGAQEDFGDAFEAWGELMKRNRDREEPGRSPIAPLREFIYRKDTVSRRD